MKWTYLTSFCFLLFCAVSYAQPTVNGDLSDPQYVTVATKLNTNSGFGSAIDVSKIVYYPDAANSRLYIGVVGKIQEFSDNGIGLWLNFSGITGTAAGNPLGGTPGGHYMSGDAGNHTGFKADFEVDYMFALNPGSVGGTHVYVYAVKLVGGRLASYIGDCGQSGSATAGPPSSGDFFAQNSVSFAFNNDGAANHGLEMRIPFAQLGVSNVSTMEAFAFVVSATAYFSDVTVPGNIPNPPGNPTWEPNFGTLATGPFHSSPPAPLPIQLSYLHATRQAASVIVNWKTISEVNNYGFEVQKKVARSTADFTTIPNSFVPGHGTTNEPQTYSYADASAERQALQYRLKQRDLDGTIHYTEAVQVDAITGVKVYDPVGETAPNEFALFQNYPNPFNPSTEIKFSVDNTAHAALNVYNLLGRKVATLFDDVAEAGHYYRVRFNASDFSSGMYFYKLESGTKSSLKKLLLLK